MEIALRVKTAHCLVFWTWRNRRTPGEGSTGTKIWNSRLQPTDPAEPSNGFRPCTPRVPPVNLQKLFLFFIISQFIKHQINLFSEKQPSKLPITTKESLFSPQLVENHFPPKFKFKNNPMNLSTKGRNPLFGSLTSVVS